MYFKPYYLGCLAQASYLIGGDNGEAAVIDPRRDVEEYLADARAAGFTVKHVIETHLHADFVSGHVELARRTGATIHMGAKAGAAFAHHAVQDGDTVTMGDVALRFVETPGHTPESLTIVASTAAADRPDIAFTGDTLFIGDVGRPDLAGSRGFTREQMADLMYDSLRTKVLALPDATEVWPAHGAGSACGRSLSDDRVSTIGREKDTNPALQFVLKGDREGFVRYAIEGLSVAPGYFSHDARRNREGAATVAEVLAAARRLSPADVERQIEDVTVLDTRSVAEFGAAHVPGAVHVQLDGNFAPWVGRILAPDTPVVVVASGDRNEEAVTRLARIGYEHVVGWLDGGMDAWKTGGGEIVCVPQVTPDELRRRLGAGMSPVVLDVRTTEEWDAGHVDGALHMPLPDLQARMADVPDRTIFAFCRTGYRSSIACSLLQRAGRPDVANAAGGWEAWSAAREA